MRQELQGWRLRTSLCTFAECRVQLDAGRMDQTVRQYKIFGNPMRNQVI